VLAADLAVLVAVAGINCHWIASPGLGVATAIVGLGGFE
jgi:hypothetical protein